MKLSSKRKKLAFSIGETYETRYLTYINLEIVPIELRLPHVCTSNRGLRSYIARKGVLAIQSCICDSIYPNLELENRLVPLISSKKRCIKCGEPCRSHRGTRGAKWILASPEQDRHSRHLNQCRREKSLESEHRLEFSMRPN